MLIVRLRSPDNCGKPSAELNCDICGTTFVSVYSNSLKARKHARNLGWQCEETTDWQGNDLCFACKWIARENLSTT